MGSLSTIAEPHCLWPLCSHTCCWEAEQRIRAGKPREVKAFTPKRASATASEEDKLPAITVVNVSEWPNAGSPTEVFPLQSEAATNTLISRAALPRPARREKKVQICNSGSATSAHLERRRGNKTIKLRTIHISPLPSSTSMSQSSQATGVGAPSSCYLPPHESKHSSESLSALAVKELILLPSAVMNKAVENKKKLKQDMLKKKPLMKQQTPVRCQLNQQGKSTDLSGPGLAWPGSDSDLQVKNAPSHVRCLLPVGQVLAAAPEARDDQQPSRSAQTLHLRKTPVVSEPVRERMQRKKNPKEEHRTFNYKLDLKPGINGIDWESLNRRTYLRTRHSQPVNSECVSPASSEDKADYVPYSLHPEPVQSYYYQFKSSLITGPSKCKHMGCVTGTWQSYRQCLASTTSKNGLLRNDDFRFWFSACFHQNPGQHATNTDNKNHTDLQDEGSLPLLNSRQSSLASSTVNLARNI